MATNISVSNFDPALKQIYRPSNVQDLTYKTRPFYAILNKFEGFGGRNMPIVLEYSNPQGRSHSFLTAQTNATAIGLEDFLLTRVSDYQVVTLDGEAIKATQGDAAALLQALKRGIDGGLRSLANSIETKLFRGNMCGFGAGTDSAGDGVIAQLHAATAPTVANPMVLTLANTAEIACFEKNMVIVATSAHVGAAARATPATATINGINRTAGTITTDYDNSGGATNWAVNDWLAVQGDPQLAAAAATAIAGLTAWIPATVRSTAFFGVDRTVDSRLSGLCVDNSASVAPLAEILIDAQSAIGAEGGIAETVLMNHVQMRRLLKELESKRVYNQDVIKARSVDGEVAAISFKTVVIDGDQGPLRVLAANKCPANHVNTLTLDTWTLNTLGPATQVLDEDGLRILRQASADGYEWRGGFYGNLATTAPIWNRRDVVPSP